MSQPEGRYSLIVFDWDGTLMDSASAIVRSIQESSREMGLPIPSRERASYVIGLGLRDALRLAVPTLPEGSYPEFVDLYRKHFLDLEPAMELFPGAVELLRELKARGRTLAVATGKSRKGLERAFDTCGVRSIFSDSRCADESLPKPDPAMLLELMQGFGTSAANTLMIGDTSHDLGMAQSAGVDAVAVTYGAHPASDLRVMCPKGLVNSMEGLRAWLSVNA